MTDAELFLKVVKARKPGDILRLLSASRGDEPEASVLYAWFVDHLLLQLREATMQSQAASASAKAAMPLVLVRHTFLAIELVWEWRVRRYLESALKEKLEIITERGLDTLDESVLGCCSTFPAPSREQAFEAAQCISDAMHSSDFHGISKRRNMGRILVAFVIFSHQQHDEEERDGGVTRALAERYLAALIRGQSKSHIVQGLQSAMRCPAEIRPRINSLMQEVLLLDGGLESVARAYLGGGDDSPPPKQVALVVRVLTSVPKALTSHAYFSALSIQLVQLIRAASKIGDEGMLAVSAGVLVKLLDLHPTLAHAAVTKQLGAPLLQLINPATAATGAAVLLPHLASSAGDCGGGGGVSLASHELVVEAVSCLRALLRFPDLRLSSRLLSSMHRCGLGQVLIYLALHCFSEEERGLALDKTNESSAAEVEAVMETLSAYLQGVPQQAAQQIEQAVMIPSLNDFSPRAALAPAPASASAPAPSQGPSSSQSQTHTFPQSQASALLCNMEIRRSGRPAELRLAPSEEGCRQVMERAALAARLLSSLSKSEGEGGAAVAGPAVAALFMRTLRAFFGVADLSTATATEADAEAEAGLGAGAAAAAAAEAAAAKSYVSSSGSGMLFPLLLEHVPPAVLLAAAETRAQIVSTLWSFLDAFVLEREARLERIEAALRSKGSERDGEERDASELQDEGQGDEECEEEREEHALALAHTALSVLHQVVLHEASPSSQLQALMSSLPPGSGSAEGLKALLPALERIAAWRDVEGIEQGHGQIQIQGQGEGEGEGGAELAQRAAELGLSILAAGLPTPNETQSRTQRSSCEGPLSLSVPPDVRALLDDPQPAMKALGCRSLVHLFLAQPDAQASPQGLREVLGELLALAGEKESFVYLAALHGICSLAGRGSCTLPVLNFLLAAWETDSTGGAEQPAAASVRGRAMVGEGLFVILRRLAGRTAGADPALVTQLAVSCLKVVRSSHAHFLKGQSVTVQSQSQSQTLAHADAEAGAEVEIEREGCPDALLLQSSALSLLAECVAAGSWSAGRYLQDVLDVVVHVLSMPRPRVPVAVRKELRRAAAFLLHRILQGLGADVFFVSEGSVVGPVYRLIKACRGDLDAVVAFHADNAFALLNSLVVDSMTGSGSGKNNNNRIVELN